MKNLILLGVYVLSILGASAQDEGHRYPQLDQVFTPFRLALPISESIEYLYLDEDKDPDGLKATLPDGKKVLWIDDDDDMKVGDIEGDLDNDCLMIDLNNDGQYGAELDLIIDYIDENNDGKADFQTIIDNGKKDYTGKWKSHYVWFVDNDQDGVFGYVNWDEFKFEGWDHSGRANFFTDYHGQSTMLKVHITSWNIEDPEYNWENPFLFYDTDQDGLSEMAIRMVDEPEAIEIPNDLIAWKYSHNISLVQMTFDLDNDSQSGNELDFDMSLRFAGKGFNYSDQMNAFGSNLVAEGSDQFFFDPRWRHLEGLKYPNHDTAYDLTFNKGDWSSCWLVFDEDDDCHRWERVEFYDPKDPFKIGSKNGGLDHNPQADAVGDRGEWDLDFSGEGNLYISPLDGKIHLLGAETGYWRIDQNSLFYQGWQGWRGPNIQPEDSDNIEPTKFATVKYDDTNNNGFFDQMSYDLDGDRMYESIISLLDMGISDEVEIHQTADMQYEDFAKLHLRTSCIQKKRSEEMIKVANKNGLNTGWYAFLKRDESIREKYNNGFWLSFYLYHDLISFKADDPKKLKSIQKSYFNIYE